MSDSIDGLASSIVNALKAAPHRAASDGSIQGLLAMNGVDATRKQVREVADVLVEDGVLEVVGLKGEGKRYELLEPEIVYRHVGGG